MNTCSKILGAAAFGALLLTPSIAHAGGPVERNIMIREELFNGLDEADRNKVLDLKSRMEALMATDRSSLSSKERKELRTEWRGMKNEMNALNRGGTVIYISTGGLILLIILLIILL